MYFQNNYLKKKGFISNVKGLVFLYTKDIHAKIEYNVNVTDIMMFLPLLLFNCSVNCYN